MQDFIVLGIVPGTNIQLDFTDWLLISLSLVLAYSLFSFILRHVQRVNLSLPMIASFVSINTNTALIGPISSDEVTA